MRWPVWYLGVLTKYILHSYICSLFFFTGNLSEVLIVLGSVYIQFCEKAFASLFDFDFLYICYNWII